MKEVTGNLWEIEAEAHVITTNGFTKKDGAAVMGRGCAREARDMLQYHEFPIDLILGGHIKTRGNHVGDLGSWKHRDTDLGSFHVISFPVKTHWRDAADPELIIRSAGELAMLGIVRGWTKVILPRPGCGSGRLNWEDVRPLLEQALDDRFVVCHFGDQ